jgi:hypothetical protein
LLNLSLFPKAIAMIRFLVLFIALILLAGQCVATPCVWQSPIGGTFDLTPLTATGHDKSYYILDGDLDCTPETEPSFSYVWNFCAPVTDIPGACSNVGKSGVALQFLESGDDSFCFIIGKYDQSHPQMRLLDSNDPSVGVSLEYPTGEKCATNVKGLMRSTIIDVQCANTPTITLHAVSDKPCQYRLTMKSYYGCPKECAITDAGLCNNHGHCGYDVVRKTSYCYCNSGYYGDACESTVDPDSSSFSGHTVQVALLVTLVLIVIVLIYSVIKMNQKIKEARLKSMSGVEYGQLASSDHLGGDVQSSGSASF